MPLFVFTFGASMEFILSFENRRNLGPKMCTCVSTLKQSGEESQQMDVGREIGHNRFLLESLHRRKGRVVLYFFGLHTALLTLGAVKCLFKSLGNPLYV